MHKFYEPCKSKVELLIYRVADFIYLCKMINRILYTDLLKALKNFPSLAILGARQTGKTTLAKQLAKQQKRKSIYLDLENPSDRDKLHDAFTYLDDNKEKLILLDEVQRMPELFAMLRSLIDRHRKSGRFILLGSASPHLVKGVSESLAGRIFNSHLGGITLLEYGDKMPLKKHWFRGGFPDMLTAKSNLLFTQRMDTFISTFIERDLQNLFGVQFTATVMRTFWQMLANANGGIWNAQNYARSLGITAPTVNRYLDFLEGSFMVHRLPAFYFNARKRIVRAPKIYLRDSGIVHRLLKLTAFEDLQGHPAIGSSWEAYVVEQIYQLKHPNIDLFYYRTQDGAEADVVLTKAGKPVACIEIKLSNSPSLSKGFFVCLDDLKTSRNFVVIPTGESYRKSTTLRVCCLHDFLQNQLPKIK